MSKAIVLGLVNAPQSNNHNDSSRSTMCSLAITLVFSLNSASVFINYSFSLSSMADIPKHDATRSFRSGSKSFGQLQITHQEKEVPIMMLSANMSKIAAMKCHAVQLHPHRFCRLGVGSPRF